MTDEEIPILGRDESKGIHEGTGDVKSYVFLTSDFTPTDLEHADLVKVFFKDGRIVFGAVDRDQETTQPTERKS